MKPRSEFLRTTLTAGLLVLFPLLALIFVILKTAGLLTNFIKPLLLNFIPQSRLIGVLLADTISILILFLLCFVVGLIVRTPIGGAFVQRMAQLLNVIPGYRMFVRISGIIFDRDDASGTPVVVQRGESRQIGFMMEQTGAEEMTIFFPDAPGLLSGTVEIVKSSTVQKLNVPPVQAARVIATFGSGTGRLLARASDKN